MVELGGCSLHEGWAGRGDLSHLVTRLVLRLLLRRRGHGECMGVEAGRPCLVGG